VARRPLGGDRRQQPGRARGAVDSAAAIKAMDFIATADAFGLPLVFLADNPGVMAGTQAERDGILKWGGKMFKAQRRARVPKLHVTMRKSFGFGAVTMGQNRSTSRRSASRSRVSRWMRCPRYRAGALRSSTRTPGQGRGASALRAVGHGSRE
jgi:hypothetical protein